MFLPHNTKIKSTVFATGYAPAATEAALQSVQVYLPNVNQTNIYQVQTRKPRGVYKNSDRQCNISFSWITTLSTAETIFNNYLTYFKARVGGIVTSMPTTANMTNTFAYVASVGYRESGFNLPELNVELVYLNCPNAYDLLGAVTTFDPLEEDVDTTDLDIALVLDESCSNDLITEYSAQATLQANLNYTLNGYRSLKYGECIIGESLTTISEDYIPSWMYTDSNLIVHTETAQESHSRSLGTNGPRTYTTNRQALLLASADTLTVNLGW